ncbi:energy transducer TonB [Marinibaculum pumilum]|uniref:Energy transducer TonB n=1 Tax=Marinibaculum pumilum TaxID=1766165 RepID=A0ABV7L0V2_9PROT
MTTVSASGGEAALPARFGTAGWLAAAVLATAIHLGVLGLSWDLPLLPASDAGQPEMRISLATLGRGSPVTLARPGVSADRALDPPSAPSSALPASPTAPPEGGAGPLPAPPVTAPMAEVRPAPSIAPEPAAPDPAAPDPAAPDTVAPATNAPHANASGAPAADPAGRAAEGATSAGIAGPAPRPRARPQHLEQADSPVAAVPAGDRDAGGSAAGSISGLAPRPGGLQDLPASPSAAPAVPGPAASAPAVPGLGGSGEGRALLDGYLSRLQGILQRSRRYPAAALADRLQGVVLLGFSLHRSGRVLGGRVIRSSGHEILDREALDLLYRVAPLPPFPPGIAAERLDLEVPIRFDR